MKAGIKIRTIKKYLKYKTERGKEQLLKKHRHILV